MTQLITSTAIALLGVLLGYQLKIIRLNKCDIFNPGELDANLGLAYEDGFNDGYNAAETEDEDDEFFNSIEEIIGKSISRESGYVTSQDLDKLVSEGVLKEFHN